MKNRASVEDIFKQHLFKEPERNFDVLVDKSVTGKKDNKGKFVKIDKPISLEVRKYERAKNSHIYKLRA